MRVFALVALAAAWPWLTGTAAPIKLASSKLELVLDPALGRITRLSLPGGRNLLWFDPHARPLPTQGGWTNWGGDKLWWGPQIDWQAVTQRRFPPDEALDLGWDTLLSTQHYAVMHSRLSAFVGIRAQREITLSTDEAEVMIKNRFTRDAQSRQRLQLWTVTQLPPPLWCWLESRPASGRASWINLRPHLAPGAALIDEPASETVRVVPSAAGNAFLIGTHGSWLAAVYDDVIFVQEISPYPDGDYAEQVSVQLFSGPDFIELETLGGVKKPTVGESIETVVRWRILERSPGLDAGALREWLRAQLKERAK